MTNFEANRKLQKLCGKYTTCIAASFPSGTYGGRDRYGILQALPGGEAVGLVASGRTWQGCFKEFQTILDDCWNLALEEEELRTFTHGDKK